MLGLETALRHNIEKLAIHLDSELIVKQICGEYRVKDKNLKELYREAQGLLQKFEDYTIDHVERSLNQDADRLANLAIDEYNGL